MLFGVNANGVSGELKRGGGPKRGSGPKRGRLGLAEHEDEPK